jgi:hypothetical protein
MVFSIRGGIGSHGERLAVREGKKTCVEILEMTDDDILLIVITSWARYEKWHLLPLSMASRYVPSKIRMVVSYE